jgi:uncharacterized SAM-binding protein YcdF (DUF218 family)
MAETALTSDLPAAEPEVNSHPALPPATGSAVARGVALFIGVFTFLNLLIGLRHPKYDANYWWVDLFPLPQKFPLLAEMMWLFAAVAWLAYALFPVMSYGRRRTTRTTIEVLLLFVGWNILSYYGLVLRGKIHTVFPVPFSVVVVLILWTVWRGASSENPSRGVRAWGVMCITIAALSVLVPLLQMVCFGLTDYRRAADLAVVFGARVDRNGVPSDAVADRVAVAVDLYKKKLVSHVLLSGGPINGSGKNETDAMRDLAVRGGVPEELILIDPQGVNTDSTVHNAIPILEKEWPVDSARQPLILAVSHFYHLPRVKMRFWREGREVLTVPVRSPLAQTPRFMLREVAALWKYYFESILN